MTLLESIVALVILGLAAMGFLEVFQRASVATRDTRAWTRAVAVAELAMEQAVLQPAPADGRVSGLHRRTTVRSWGPGLREVVVTVDLDAGAAGRVELHRLVPAQ